MGISFGKRKVKIKLLGQTEAVKEEEKQSEPVQTYRQEIIVSNPKPKVNRTFKEALKEITEQSKKLNLSDFTVYQYYYSDGRYKFSLLFSVGLTARIISLSGHLFSMKHLKKKQ